MSTANTPVNMLVISRADIQHIFEHCDGEYPNEACGILGGHANMVDTVYPMMNARPSPPYYEMDPKEHFRVITHAPGRA